MYRPPMSRKSETRARWANAPLTFDLNHNSGWPSSTTRESGRMYAICFDLEQEALQRHYPSASFNNGYDDIRRVLEIFGFRRQQGSVYFGDEHVTPVTCVMAVQEIQKRHSWFGKAVIDLRMLRIEEHNNLIPAIAQLELALDAAPAPVA
jgi:virulence-associated protein VapD